MRKDGLVSRAVVSGLGGAVVIAILIVLGVSMNTTSLGSSDILEASSESSSFISKTWRQMDIIANFEQVQEYLAWVGANETTLDDYVPVEIKFEVRPDLIKQEIGADAMTGYVAVSLYYEKSIYCTNYLMLFDMEGNIKSLLPVTAQNRTIHFDALKPYDEKRFTVVANFGNMEYGNVYLWNWYENTLEDISGGMDVDSHDVQWSHTNDETFFVCTDWGFARYEAYSGNLIEDYTLFDASESSDVNHVQLIENDTGVLISDRSYNRVMLWNRSTGQTEWVCGGSEQTLDAYDMDGNLMTKNSLFYGQHNAEFFGENEYYIFDNNYNADTFLYHEGNSRAIIVEIEATQNRAQLIWEYEFPGFAYAFGDNDRLPSSNILTTWWPRQMNKDTGVYDLHGLEIVRDTKEVAWHMQVMGKGCDLDTTSECLRSTSDGWKTYSIERIYTEPIVYDIQCVDNTLSFSTHNTFKENNIHEGLAYWHAPDGTVLSETYFDWVPYWRTTTVTLSTSTSLNDYASTNLRITNKFGQQKVTTISCAAS